MPIRPDGRMPSSLGRALTAGLDLLFPRLHCPLCGSDAGDAHDAGICPTCLATLLTAPAAPGVVPPGTIGGFACGAHEGPLASAIRRLKYGGQESLGEPLGRLLAARAAMAVAAGLTVDAVVPVPLHRQRLRQRGFNQAETIARHVAIRLAVPCRPEWLSRVRRTTAQAGLGRAARLHNVVDAFRGSVAARGRALLVVDDVTTTGATFAACATALAGAHSVAYAALAAADA